jgi:FkbM family methyltransferase
MRKLLDAGKFVKRAIGAFRGRELWQGTQIQCEQVWLGNAGACWCVCPGSLSESSVVYSFGVGEDVSFDLELIRRFRVELHAFDPTPRSIDWITSQPLPHRFIFHNFGIHDHDGIAVFTPPENANHVSYSALQRRTTSVSAIKGRVHRLATIMEQLGHTDLDLLKMDIEGAEYGVLADLVRCHIPVKQLLVEFHHRWPEVGIEQTKHAIRALNSAGYLIFCVSPSGEEYSFVRSE